MADYLRYLLARMLVIPVTMLIVTAVLYGFIMLTPPEVRAELYLPPNLQIKSPEHYQNLINMRIKMYHLDDPYPIQYALWLKSLVQG